ncbi:hypothetical protein [Deinococcus sp.]|uniref:hypothetical protein n=1 Tax=Deinococcus sp. TaxID=47478 RepID=UPI0025D460F7|nr:hypothetical protein [Deinococcus sp.]
MTPATEVWSDLPEVWSDLYGAAHVRYQGRPGGRAWLVACEAEQGLTVAERCEAFMQSTRLKGQLELLVHAGLAPLEGTLREGRFSGVLVIGLVTGLVSSPPLSGGPATREAAQTVTTVGGLSYREGGALPAWASALTVDGEEGENAAASLCASLDVPVVVCPAELLGEVLLRWAGSVVHGLSL